MTIGRTGLKPLKGTPRRGASCVQVPNRHGRAGRLDAPVRWTTDSHNGGGECGRVGLDPPKPLGPAFAISRARRKGPAIDLTRRPTFIAASTPGRGHRPDGNLRFCATGIASRAVLVARIWWTPRP